MTEDNLFIFIIEVVGTIAFAISGIRLAAAKNFDWFGAYVVGLVTAIGGGTLRDLLLGIPVFWMQSGMYLSVTFLSLVIVIIFRRFLVGGMRTLFLFDAIGLALFVVVGIEKSFGAGYPAWVAIVMGIITGSFGGVTRDILINEECAARGQRPVVELNTVAQYVERFSLAVTRKRAPRHHGRAVRLAQCHDAAVETLTLDFLHVIARLAPC